MECVHYAQYCHTQHIHTIAYTVGLINFENKKFRGFRGYLLNLEIKYPCNFLYTRSRFFVQHVHVVGKWLALLQTSSQSQNFSTIAYTGSSYRATFSCGAATKEIQRVIDTINDGTQYLRGAVRIGTYTL